MKTLIAEDDTLSRHVLRRTLEKLGHEVWEAGNGEEAISLFKQESFQVVISDCLMPVMDGMELCRRIRATSQKDFTYVILLTASDSGHGFQAAMEAGADDYAVKPLILEQLAMRLYLARRMIQLHEEIKELRTRVCSCCGDQLNEQGHWIPSELSVEKKRQSMAQSHTICPTCWSSQVGPGSRESRSEPTQGGFSSFGT